MRLAQKIKQVSKLYNQRAERQLYRKGLNNMNLRKSRTRTLIQAGGLVEKAGLLTMLNLYLGDDLQKNEQHFDAVAILMAAFCDLTQILQEDDAQKILWRERGKKALSS